MLKVKPVAVLLPICPEYVCMGHTRLIKMNTKYNQLKLNEYITVSQPQLAGQMVCAVGRGGRFIISLHFIFEDIVVRLFFAMYLVVLRILYFIAPL